MITFVLPTRDRPERLARTLDALGKLTIAHSAEVVVADNASAQPVRAPAALPNGLSVRTIRLEHNAGAAARNAAAQAASPRASWILMLDDDSHPVEAAEPLSALIERLAAQPTDVAAVMADIHLPATGRREAGGLPEVFVGCGVAIRRDAFAAVGGYDASFGYYVEEYDLAARLMLAGWRTVFDPAFVVHHHKVEAGRDMNLILARLVRNNGWVMQRYAPDDRRREMLREQRRRYRLISDKEHALPGFANGLVELRRTVRAQPRRPMPLSIWDRFTGLAHAREALRAAWRERPFATAAIVEPGKNCWAVERALSDLGRETGLEITTADQAEVLVLGTLSPGPMLDAVPRWTEARRRVVAPWLDARAAAPAPYRAVA